MVATPGPVVVHNWLVVKQTPLKNYESHLGWLFPIYGKTNVPNHQPDNGLSESRQFQFSFKNWRDNNLKVTSLNIQSSRWLEVTSHTRQRSLWGIIWTHHQQSQDINGHHGCVPSGNQTWQAGKSTISTMIFPLKPPFTWDFPATYPQVIMEVSSNQQRFHRPRSTRKLRDTAHILAKISRDTHGKTWLIIWHTMVSHVEDLLCICVSYDHTYAIYIYV